MLDLRKFYLVNIRSSSPYFKYYGDIEKGLFSYLVDGSTDNLELVIHDDVREVIQKLKKLIQPGNNYNQLDSLKFILVCFYLDHHGYYIVQFSNNLSYPTDLNDFANNKIRNHLIAKGRSDDGTVRWAERRLLIEELEFELKNKINTDFPESIERKFQEISTRGAAFDNMSSHEKLKEIANYLENNLKVDKKYLSINEEQMLELIPNDTVKQYRYILQCYRHSSKESLDEREKLKDKERFLIYLGIAIIHGLHDN